MRNSLLALIVIAVLFAGCSKKFHYADGPISSSIIGKWVFTEYFISPGDAGKWYKAKPAGKVMDFRADGKFASTRNEFKQFSKYELMAPGKVRLLTGNSVDESVLLAYSIDTEHAWLFTYPGEAICIEGCVDKYRKVK